MPPTITAFAASPDRGQGLARDMPVRWALAEVGMPHDVRLHSFAALKQADHRAIQPFGQIPTFQDGPIATFESGAIVLHVARGQPALWPEDPAAQARAMSWIFAALNTVEPPIRDYDMAPLLERDQPWFAARQTLLCDRVLHRLADLSAWLGGRDWLEAGFTAGDLMMVSVLRRLHGTGLLEVCPNLAAYVARAEARPAFRPTFRAAFAAQRAVFTGQPSGD